MVLYNVKRRAILLVAFNQVEFSLTDVVCREKDSNIVFTMTSTADVEWCVEVDVGDGGVTMGGEKQLEAFSIAFKACHVEWRVPKFFFGQIWIRALF